MIDLLSSTGLGSCLVIVLGIARAIVAIRGARKP